MQLPCPPYTSEMRLRISAVVDMAIIGRKSYDRKYGKVSVPIWWKVPRTTRSIAILFFLLEQLPLLNLNGEPY